ncbi:MAG: hypothetical protein WCS43_14380, partial [Verrucomicrobiota bacterium]
MTTSNFKHRNTAYTFLLFAPALLLVFIVLAVSWAPEFRLEYLPWTCIGSIAGISSAWFLVSLKRLMDCRTVAADMKDAEWIVCQIGAREHYTVPCALHKVGRLELLVTDIWQKFDTRIGRFFAKGRMFQRWHPALADAQVWAPNSASLIFEGILRRLRRVDAPASTIRRNNRFQRQAVALLEDYERSAPGKHRVLFAFSYGAAELFKFAKSRGWTTVLGQIDP